MRTFSIHVNDISTGSVAGTFTSLLGLKLPNTAGARARLRSIIVGGVGGGAGPQDVQVEVKVVRTDNTSDGTATAVDVGQIAKHDEASLASLVSAVKSQYTVEPTTKEAGAVAGGPFNARGYLQSFFPDPEQAPVWGPNQTLLLEASPGSAVTVNLAIQLEWEEF